MISKGQEYSVSLTVISKVELKFVFNYLMVILIY